MKIENRVVETNKKYDRNVVVIKRGPHLPSCWHMFSELHFSKISFAYRLHKTIFAYVRLIRRATPGGYPRVGVVISTLVS